MSLTSYRTAPSRDTILSAPLARATCGRVAADGQLILRNHRFRDLSLEGLAVEGNPLRRSAKTPKGPPLRVSPVDYVNGCLPRIHRLQCLATTYSSGP